MWNGENCFLKCLWMLNKYDWIWKSDKVIKVWVNQGKLGLTDRCRQDREAFGVPCHGLIAAASRQRGVVPLCLCASVPRWCLCPQTLPIPAGIISKHVNYPQQKLKQTKHFFHFQETIWAWSINWTNLRATTSSYQYIKKKYINSSANERMKCGKNGWMTLVIVWLDLTW